MCENCYRGYGSPTIVNEKVLAAVTLVRQVYESSCVGGNLHIALDDWNLDDDNLKFCSNEIDKAGNEGRDSPLELKVERACCDAFMAMSEDERASALAIHDGFWILKGL